MQHRKEASKQYPNYHPADRETVGYDHVVEVDKSRTQEDGTKKHAKECRHGVKLEPAGGKKECRNQLNQRLTDTEL